MTSMHFIGTLRSLVTWSIDKRITMDRCFCKSHDKRLKRRPATNPLKHDLHTDALPPNHETTGSIGDTPKMFRITRIVVIVVIEKEVQLTSNWEFPQVEKIVEVLSLVCLTYVTDLTDLPQSPPYCSLIATSQTSRCEGRFKLLLFSLCAYRKGNRRGWTIF